MSKYCFLLIFNNTIYKLVIEFDHLYHLCYWKFDVKLPQLFFRVWQCKILEICCKVHFILVIILFPRWYVWLYGDRRTMVNHNFYFFSVHPTTFDNENQMVNISMIQCWRLRFVHLPDCSIKVNILVDKKLWPRLYIMVFKMYCFYKPNSIIIV